MGYKEVVKAVTVLLVLSLVLVAGALQVFPVKSSGQPLYGNGYVHVLLMNPSGVVAVKWFQSPSVCVAFEIQENVQYRIFVMEGTLLYGSAIYYDDGTPSVPDSIYIVCGNQLRP